MTTILITGADGFFGSYFYRYMARKNFQGIKLVAHRRSGALAGNLCYLDSVDRVLRSAKPDIIVHCAGRVPRATSDFEKSVFGNDNVVATQNIVTAASGLPTKPYILFPGTAGVYRPGGIADTFRQRAREVIYAREEAAVSERVNWSDYVRSKFAAEQAVRAYEGPWTILRKPTVIGEGDKRGNFLQKLALYLVEGYTPQEDILHGCADYIAAEDVCGALWSCIRNDNSQRQIINIGSGRSVTGFTAYSTLAKTGQEIGVPVIYREVPDTHPMDAYPGTVLDITKAHQVLRFRPKIDFEMLCRLFWMDIKNQPVTPRRHLQSILLCMPV